ncbi:MAG TPA: DMT family transporter [Gaiellaceae bacterium]|nr:DMT family transporter [Gaiellaceae bacterium]
MNLAALGYALSSSLSWGVADFIAGFKSRALGALPVLLPAQLAGLVLAAAIVAGRLRGWPGDDVLWAIPAAVAGTFGLVAFLRGMAVGSMSVVAPIAGTSAVIPVVFGVATGDRLGAVTGTGVAAAIAGVVLASREREEGRPVVAAGAGWALLAALGWGFYFPPLHEAAQVDPSGSVLVFRCTSVTLTALALLAAHGSFPHRRHLPVLAVSGLLDVGGNLLFALASAERGLVSVVSVLASLYPIVTVALASIVLRERPAPLQWVGIALTFAGIGLIAAG